MSVVGCHGHTDCLYDNIFVSPVRNVLPDNVNDAMIISNSISAIGKGLANVSKNC